MASKKSLKLKYNWDCWEAILKVKNLEQTSWMRNDMRLNSRMSRLKWSCQHHRTNEIHYPQLWQWCYKLVYREGISCFPARKHPEKYDVSCDREYEWFPAVIFNHCSYSNFRTGSMSLSSATSNTHSWILRLTLSWASIWNSWSWY